MKKAIGLILAVASAMTASAVVVDVVGAGVEKFDVAINVANADFAKCLKKNLELSGVFNVKSSASIKVSGNAGAVKAEGLGKTVASAETFTDAKSARMAARKFSDAMVAAFSRDGQKGFAAKPLAFVKRGGKRGNEICTGYPDGGDIRQLTSDGKAALCPRWKNATTIYYIGYLNGSQRVYEIDLAAGKRRLALDIRGVSSPAVVSPDGTKVALVSSFQGNPDLYVLVNGRLKRMTNTPNATEGCPSWSPDGREIVYMSDESRRQQLYVVDIATKRTRRLTSRGRDNVEPDWGADGRIAYVSKRAGGAQVAVLDPAAGDQSAQLVTEPGNWEHPTWACDRRHVAASRDKALFIVDTLEGGDKPRRMFAADGNWIDPTWMK